MQACQLSICLVVYGLHKSDTLKNFTATLASLRTSLIFSKEQTADPIPRLEHVEIWVVCNDETPNIELLKNAVLSAGWMQADLDSGCFKLIAGQGNVGFAKANNIAILSSTSQYHLILNPDVLMEEDAIFRAWFFAHQNPKMGLLSPSVSHSDGSKQYLCKQEPSVLTLLLRGFAPRYLKNIFKKRLSHYEMRDVMTGREDQVYMHPKWVSGAFMWFDSSVLKKLEGFCPKFFLYFEDTDLSYRAARITKIAYVPQIRIIHLGGNAAKKGYKHIYLFIRSAITFFNLHGWRWW